jgi:mutator protein MutT
MPLSDYYSAIRSAIGDQLLFTPSVNAIIVNTQGHVLLQRRADNGEWPNPGGAIEPGEHPAQAIVREVKEETGLDVQPVRITGVYSGPDYFHTYPDGNRTVFVTISFLCEVIGGQMGGDPEETVEVRFFAPSSLPGMRPRFARRIHDALRGNADAVFDLD